MDPKNMTAQAIDSEIAQIEGTLSVAFAEAGSKGDLAAIGVLSGDDDAKSQQIADMNGRLSDLKAEADRKAMAASSARWIGDGKGGPFFNSKTLGERIADAGVLRYNGGIAEVPYDAK